jgi:integrase
MPRLRYRIRRRRRCRLAVRAVASRRCIARMGRHRGAIPWAALKKKVLALYEPGLAEAATRRQMHQIFRELDALGLRCSTDLDEQAVARWIAAHRADPRRGPNRAESLLRCVRIIANFAKSKGYLRVSPFDVKRFGTWIKAKAYPRRGKVRYKSSEQLQRLIEVADRKAATGGWVWMRARIFAYILLFTGRRSGEVRHILARNVNLEKGTIKIVPVGNWRPKTIGTGRTYAIPPVLVSALREWLPVCGANPFLPDDAEQGPIWLLPGRRGKKSKPWKGSRGYMPIDYIRELADEAGIGDMTIIGFRKSLGTNAKAAGLGGLERKELLGHSDEKTGDWYDEERVETMRPAVAKLADFYAPRRAAQA